MPHRRHEKFDTIAKKISHKEHIPMKNARAILASAKRKTLKKERSK